MERAERRPLGTDEALAPDVGVVGTDRDHAIAVGLYLEPAHGFAEGTGPEMRHRRRPVVRTCDVSSHVAPLRTCLICRAGFAGRGTAVARVRVRANLLPTRDEVSGRLPSARSRPADASRRTPAGLPVRRRCDAAVDPAPPVVRIPR